MLVNEEKKDILEEQRLVDSITKYTAFITQLWIIARGEVSVSLQVL